MSEPSNQETLELASSEKPAFVFMFDFDHTLVDENTDTFVFQELKPEMMTDLKDWRHSGLSWTNVMRKVFEKLLSSVTVNQVTEWMEKCPISEKTVEFLKEIHKCGHEINIISDSNTYFISTILDKHQIRECISNIHTNTAVIDHQKNTIDITEYSVAFNKPHTCETCPENMCKGEIVREIMNHHLSPHQHHCSNLKFIYCGDGKNDFCACKQLRNIDLALPRKDFTLEKVIESRPTEVSCQIKKWHSFEHLNEIILQELNVKSHPQDQA